ncbi:MAG TPA: hypothetical protein VNW99_04725 [Cytophagaceae bacterium]|jgi:hypothetical protein|nr:hypothetical protein [Cytophagaceae bacterium]
MSYILITEGIEIGQKDIVKDPDNKLYLIVDKDPTFDRVMLHLFNGEESDPEKKIIVHAQSMVNKWRKLIKK